MAFLASQELEGYLCFLGGKREVVKMAFARAGAVAEESLLGGPEEAPRAPPWRMRARVRQPPRKLSQTWRPMPRPKPR